MVALVSGDGLPFQREIAGAALKVDDDAILAPMLSKLVYVSEYRVEQQAAIDQASQGQATAPKVLLSIFIKKGVLAGCATKLCFFEGCNDEAVRRFLPVNGSRANSALRDCTAWQVCALVTVKLVTVTLSGLLHDKSADVTHEDRIEICQGLLSAQSPILRVNSTISLRV